jgi:VIT1/CCC1 family predicted Fe2+/Mn2+ transporter
MRNIIMKHSLMTGFSFGLTSGIITTLGLMVGLHSGTHSRLAVLGGILTIAVADAFSDALGIHISEESENRHSTAEIWMSTISTFASKFIFALTFVVPVILCELSTAIMISIIWGLSILCILSFFMARRQQSKPLNAVLEHLVIAVAVIVATHYVGHLISFYFGSSAI